MYHMILLVRLATGAQIEHPPDAQLFASLDRCLAYERPYCRARQGDPLLLGCMCRPGIVIVIR